MTKEEKWIPCSERMPKDRREVLVTAYWHGTYQVMMASYFGDGLWWCVPFNNSGEHSQRLKPKAWMPLPKPYKEDLRDICNERIEIECTHGTCKDCFYYNIDEDGHGYHCEKYGHTRFPVYADFYCKDFEKRGGENELKAIPLDKVKKAREEIQKLRGCSCSCSDGIIDDVEDILDKLTESEDKE